MSTKRNKVKKSKLEKKSFDELNTCDKHDFSVDEISHIQEKLLNWYDKNQRVLPWRTIAKDEVDSNKRGYAVWVSEIMLQQTQVATVISYFNKWMKKWPTVCDLASADLEDVNKVWAGLGYYSRAKRLHEGARIVMEKLGGTIPQTVDELMSLIPGIGMYSASAIASVAFQKPVGVVDGNVIRVLSRIRVIGSHITQPPVRNHLWNLANKIVSVERPGDFNQALMELGAVICTPQNPKCSECPLNACCIASKIAKNSSNVGSLDCFLKKESKTKTSSVNYNNGVTDIENAASCILCLPSSAWKENPQVTAYPCKIEKKSSRIERVGVVIIKQDDHFLMTKRPETGLLAGLWEFPSIIFQDNSDAKENKSAVDSLLFDFGIPSPVAAKRKHIGEVVHIFSHIRTTYVISLLELNSSIKIKNVPKEIIWYTDEEIQSSAVSTAMKKCLNAVKNKSEHVLAKAPAKKRKMTTDNVKQKSIKSFFT